MKKHKSDVVMGHESAARWAIRAVTLGVVLMGVGAALAAQLAPEVLAGSGEVGFQDGVGSQAKFSDQITAMAADPQGNVFVADYGNSCVRKVGVDGQVTTFVAGAKYWTNGFGTTPSLGQPYGLALDGKGVLYVSDYQGILDGPGFLSTASLRILKVNLEGQVSVVNSLNNLEVALGNAPSWHDVAVARDGYVGYLEYWPGERGYYPGKSIMELDNAGVSRKLVNRTAFVDHEFEWLTMRSLTATPFGEYCFLQRQKDGTDWIVRLTPSGVLTVVFKAPAGISALAVGPQGQTYVIMGASVTNRAIARVVSPDTLETLYPSASLGNVLTVNAQGNLYAMESNRVVRLGYPLADVVVEASSSGGGSVTVSPQLATYPLHSDVTITPAPLSGWEFMGWGGSVEGTAAPLALNLESNVTVQANFGTPLKLSGSHAAFTKKPDQLVYPYGTQVQVSAAPEAGYVWTGWADGVKTQSRSVVMTNTVDLQAVIVPDLRFTVTAPMPVDLIRMSLEGIAGKTIQISYSDDLKTWTPYVVLQLSAQRTTEFAVAREPHPRFYRAQFVE